MADAPEDRRAATMTVTEAGQFAEAYQLRPRLAEAAAAEAQGHTGSLVQYSIAPI